MSEPSLEAITRALKPRAMGIWRRDADSLNLIHFLGGSLDPAVATEFQDATRKVSLSDTGLGIVLAALKGQTQISLACELPQDSGSGLWLHRFGADLSVAVPILLEGHVSGVISVAIRDFENVRDEAISRLVEFSQSPAAARILEPDCEG